jgi:DNA-binding response OmpR family regulator
VQRARSGDARDGALQAGARDFIVKPFKPDAVITTLRKVLEKEE